MKAFDIRQLLSQREQFVSARYLEFLSEGTLSVGLYVLPAGGTDTQQPHTEDEVYYVISGRGQFRLENESRPVQAGSVIFVAAHQEHRFHTIEEELQILVFFAPAEYTNRKS